MRGPRGQCLSSSAISHRQRRLSVRNGRLRCADRERGAVTQPDQPQLSAELSKAILQRARDFEVFCREIEAAYAAHHRRQSAARIFLYGASAGIGIAAVLEHVLGR